MGTDSFDNRHNLDKAFSAYGPPKKVPDPIHNRSKSVNENKKQSNVYNTQDQHEERNKSKQGHKRPKSNLDMVAKEKTNQNFFLSSNKDNQSRKDHSKSQIEDTKITP